MAHELSTEILIVGGGLGGCAAALAVARLGRRAILTEETDWIGGQLTAQAVPPDEHGWIESFGCTASYRQLRNGIRECYRSHYPLTDVARRQTHFNPGNAWVSPLCHEPIVALAVLQEMLKEHIANGAVQLLTEHRPISAETTTGDLVSAVTFQDLQSDTQKTISAQYVLDATDLGDVLPFANVEFRVGSDAQADTNEPDAGQVARPENVQAMSVCFAVDAVAGEDNTIERPSQYDFWRDYVPNLTPAWPGRLLSWTGCHPRTMEAVQYSFSPHQESSRAFSGLWTYRRILARDNFQSGAFPSDICTINWPMIDYLEGHLFNDTPEQNASHLAAAKQQSLSLLYWLQTEAERPDGGCGFPELRLRKDVVGTSDGLAKTPYIRESRRIEAEFTVCQQHISAETGSGSNRAQPFEDSVGIGSYRIDLHPSTGGDNYLDMRVLPFQIPLGSLIPVRVENLLPAAKNLGVTHITGGCYRLHPVEWNIGEAAGALAAFCLNEHETPRGVHENVETRRAFQSLLAQLGVELEWPHDIVLADGDPHVHAM